MGCSILSNKDYEKILHFLSLIQDHQGDYRYKVIKHISDIFTFNRITFHLTDQNGRFISPLGINISKHLFQMYEEHYFKTDIFNPINVSAQLVFSRKALTIKDLMPLEQFESTEYYNDFLKKDNLYYEIAIPLKAGTRLIGGIGIYRSKTEGDFTEREFDILSNISHHISYQLNEYLETTQNKNQQQIYKNCISQLPIGLIVLDSKQNIINSNDTARTYCLDILGGTFLTDPVKDVTQNVFPNISFESINFSTVIYNDLDSYNLKIVPSIVPSLQNGIETYYLCYLDKKAPNEGKNLQLPSCKYNLTDRELEIVELISQGLSNKEIASLLYISSHTVRTHVDNIFNKLNVSNRTSIIYKMGMIEKKLQARKA